MTGTRRDNSVHQMAGVIMFGVRDGHFSWARFYLEQVQAGEAMSHPLQASGMIPVFGRGDNPVNFVSAADVATPAELAVTGSGLRGQVLELGGPDNLTFNELAATVQETTRRRGTVRHIPRHAVQAMAWLTAAIKPALRMAPAASWRRQCPRDSCTCWCQSPLLSRNRDRPEASCMYTLCARLQSVVTGDLAWW